MSVDFCYLEFSISEIVWYGAASVQMNLRSGKERTTCYGLVHRIEKGVKWASLLRE